MGDERVRGKEEGREGGEDRKYHNKVNFIPDLSRCPPAIYNFFTGFNTEIFMSEVEMNKIHTSRHYQEAVDWFIASTRW